MNPFTWIASVTFTTLLLLPALAEVEYEIHTGYSTGISCFGKGKPATFPILIELADDKGEPIPNAIVVLKRMGPDGWTEEELKKETTSITDKNGMITLLYPIASAVRDAKGEQKIAILGAVTVITKGHPSTTIELRDHFKDGHHTTVPGTAPHIQLTLPAPQR